ncbi:MAG: MFS transporter [Candidatus Rokuibacteriota bacterium]|nr:MAG: MFS transporter [Candidatus Rokubacteria bacterium]
MARSIPSAPRFFYGWSIVAIAFVTMGVGVNARTAFSLFFPPILDEFGWPRGLTAGAFSFGFLVSAILGPILGRMMDRRGPRAVMLLGVALAGAGLGLAPLVTAPWHLYLTLGVLVGGGTVCLGYTGHALFLPNWFVRRRGLAIGVAFSGAGVGAVILLPWLQRLIAGAGWRAACLAMAGLVVVTLAPLNLLARRRPEDMGLLPDGDPAPAATIRAGAHAANVVDHAWASTDWTLALAMRTARFWWVAVGFAGGLFAWYAVQVHQTKYLMEIGFAPAVAAGALGLVGFTGIAGQIGLGHLSDRIGREWVWTLSCVGFALSYLLLLAMRQHPTPLLLYSMVFAQGVLGYGLASVFGAIPAELFQGKHYGTIFGTLSLASIVGGAIGPWVAGALHDRTGSYVLAFWLAVGACVVSAGAMWLAAPRKVRAVAGRVPRRSQGPPAGAGAI